MRKKLLLYMVLCWVISVLVCVWLSGLVVMMYDVIGVMCVVVVVGSMLLGLVL